MPRSAHAVPAVDWCGQKQSSTIMRKCMANMPHTIERSRMSEADLTRTEALMSAVRTKIANRALGPGDRLPSVRRFAETMGVSPSTVVEAYDRLEAEGVIRARR